MLFSWKDITLLLISSILLFLINYIIISTCYIYFHFSNKFENNLLKQINNYIPGDYIKVKKNNNIYEFTKDLLIIVSSCVLVMISLLIYIIYINFDLFNYVYKETKDYIILNILLFMLFNVPFYLYIIYYTSNYIQLDIISIIN